MGGVKSLVSAPAQSFKICYNLTRLNSSFLDLYTHIDPPPDLWQWAAGSSYYWTIKSIIYICTQSLKPQQQCKQEKNYSHKCFQYENEMFLLLFFSCLILTAYG